MRPKLQKQSALKLAGRIIPARGNNKKTSSGQLQDWPFSFITSYLRGIFFIEKNTP
jgi:hypothetical protein